MTTTENPTRNGVDTATLFATLDAVKASPEIAKFQFRATNRWISGTHNTSTIHGFYGAGQELAHREVTTFDADHPQVLVGEDHAQTPVEFLLHAIAAWEEKQPPEDSRGGGGNGSVVVIQADAEIGVL